MSDLSWRRPLRTMNQPGRRWVMGSIAFAFLSLGSVPVMFGPLGIIAGVVAVAKGARWYGTVGIVASFVAAGISLYWDAGLP